MTRTSETDKLGAIQDRQERKTNRRIEIGPKNIFEKWYQYIINTSHFWPAALLIIILLSNLVWIIRDIITIGFDLENINFWPITVLLVLLLVTAERTIGSQVIRRLEKEKDVLLEQLNNQ